MSAVAARWAGLAAEAYGVVTVLSDTRVQLVSAAEGSAVISTANPSRSGETAR